MSVYIYIYIQLNLREYGFRNVYHIPACWTSPAPTGRSDCLPSGKRAFLLCRTSASLASGGASASGAPGIYAAAASSVPGLSALQHSNSFRGNKTRKSININ